MKTLSESTIEEKAKLVNFIEANGIIDMHRAWEEMHMGEIEKIKKEHLKTHGKFKIRKDRGKLYYFTTFDRKTVRGKTEEELWDKLLVKYKEKKSCPTVEMIYQEKLKDKCLAGSSMRKYKRNYKFYIENTGLSNIKVNVITPEYLEKFVKKVIAEKKLNTKQYSDFVWVLKDILKRALKKELIVFSPNQFFKDIEIEKNELQKVRKRKSEEVIFTDEETLLILDFIKKNPSIRNLAIEMVFRTGARISEISVLTANDFNRHSMTVSINKTEETINKDDATAEQLANNNGKEKSKTICVVKDYPKTDDSYRNIVLEEKAFDVLEHALTLSPNSEYLFSDNGIRIRSNALRKSLYRICDAVGIKRRAPHCGRRFYATTLLDAGLDDEFVKEQCGHADIKTTRQHYLYCKSELAKKQCQIKKAINY